MNEFFTTYLITCLGVLISVALPILRLAINNHFDKDKGEVNGLGARANQLFVAVKPYLLMGVLSLIIGLLVVAAAQESLDDWRAALLAGYAGDSTVQKLNGKS